MQLNQSQGIVTVILPQQSTVKKPQIDTERRGELEQNAQMNEY